MFSAILIPKMTANRLMAPIGLAHLITAALKGLPLTAEDCVVTLFTLNGVGPGPDRGG